MSENGKEQAEIIAQELTQSIGEEFQKLPIREKDILFEALGSFDPENKPQGIIGQTKVVPAELPDYQWVLEKIFETSQVMGWNESFIGYAGGLLYSFVSGNNKPLSTGWVASFNGRSYGALLMATDTKCKHGTISFFYVALDARNLKMGSKLIEKCIDAAKELTMLSITAEISTMQNDVEHLLKKSGFERQKKTITDVRFGKADTWIKYVYHLPLDLQSRGSS